MTGLVDVFSSWFRSFGYTTQTDATLEGVTGQHYAVPLVIERDARRVAAFTWFRTEALDATIQTAIVDALKDTGCDSALLLCLGPVNENQKLRLAKDKVTVWDAKRIIQELGEAVLAETVPDLWTRTDPLLPPRPSKVLDQVVQRHEVPTPPAPSVQQPLPVASDPVQEAPFPAAVPPVLAKPGPPAQELQLPLAFGILDVAPEPPVAAPAPRPVAAPAPAAPARLTPPPAFAAPRTSKPVLRSQVSKNLALSLCKTKIRSPDKVFLRLSPYHVYDYEAHLLVEGSLDAQVKAGRMAVDAVQKRIMEWTLPLETGDINPEGADVDEKKVRVTDADAQSVLKQELVKLVTRDVVMEEDASEWSVVVKKKVTLGADDVRLKSLGTYWLPVWRVSGKDGAIEIDASTGTIVFEEILTERTDSQLI